MSGTVARPVHPARIERRGRGLVVPLAIGLVGLAASIVGFFVDPRQAYASWLAAFAAGASIALGALILVCVTHLTGARWFDPLRRIALDVAGTLPLFALLFIPILAGLGRLYPWVGRAPAAGTAYLNVPFFVVRAVAYFALWAAVALLLRRWAIRHTPDADAPPAGRERTLAAIALPALGLTLTFAAFDWLMSLAPDWSSTIFGVYWFAGGFLAALAVTALAATLRPAGLEEDSSYGLGALLLTFVIFWAYIAYCQYLIIWIGDVPAEISWYVPRVRGSWGALALVLLGGQFVLPLLALLPHAAKVSSRALAPIAAWLLVMHWLDTYWLVVPAFHPDAVHPSWLDLSALMAVAGTGTAWAMWLRPA
jgi:hypothetical protein